MSNAITTAKVAILTGAGTSIKLGIPAMAGMVKEYRTQTLGSRQKQALDLLDQLGVDHDLEQVLLAVEEVERFGDGHTIDLVLNRAADKLEDVQLGNLKSALTQSRNTLNALKTDILEWMSAKCFQFDREEANRQWGELCKVLARKQIPLFTTNYDFAVEEAAGDFGVSVIDNFKLGHRGRWFWDKTLQTFNEPGLKIVKLHGSVNWYSTEDRSEIERIDTYASRNRDGLSIDRVAIFPTRFKDIYDPHFFSIYRLFLRCLANVDTLIVVGSSLRDEYLRAALRDGLRRKEFVIVHIGPEEPRFEDFPPRAGRAKKQFVHIKRRFEDFSDELAYILDQTGSNEIAQVSASLASRRRAKARLRLHSAFRSPVSAGVWQSRKLDIRALAVPRATIKATFISLTSSKSYPVTIFKANSNQPVELYGDVDRTVDIRLKAPEIIKPTERGDLEIRLDNKRGESLGVHIYKLTVSRTPES